ncbi:MAG: diguanylate cyclase [Clostridia bacterium]|nr:diguanylate cyclase [Clostridia bacterium]
MKIKNKIAVTVIPVLILAIIIINIAFGVFFQNYILENEKDRIQSSEFNISSYINEKINKYVGTVNDWGHWDDTFKFINGQNNDYIALNLAESTFSNLELNFIILLNNDKTILFQRFYELDKGVFAEFPVDFSEDFVKVINYSKSDEDTSGILKIGENFYFIASTKITDSLLENKANGTMIFGRQIDSMIIEDMENISGCSISSINILDNIKSLSKTNQPFIIDDSYNKNANSINIEIAFPNLYDPNSSIVISMMMSRDLYISGMKEVRWFSVLNTIGSIFVCMAIFFLLGNYITKPFDTLVKDVKSVEIKKDQSVRIEENGTDEFSYIRRSINGLLSKIDASQKELVESKEKLLATLTSVGDGVITVDKNNKIQFLNPIAQKLTGWKLDEAMNVQLETVFYIINEFTREPVESPVQAVFETEGIVELTNHTLLVSKDGVEVPIEDTAAPIKDSNGSIIGCVLVFRDFSERKEKQRRIEYLSFHDQLTGLYNRRFFEEELRRIDIKKNFPLSFVYADVNGLKIINDAFGHAFGDEIIQNVAEVLKNECRSNDIIARIGGDEFVILLPQTTAASVEKLVKRIEETISNISVMDVHISISFGWETKVSIKQSAIDVLKSAENFMYQKKILNSTSKRNGIIKSILNTLLIKSPREKAHSIRVSRLCEQIGIAYQLNIDDIRELSTAGELHDIGKIAVDEAILNKVGRLSASEWAQIKHHPEIGYRLLGATTEFNNLAECVLAHHERWDGSGYPKGLKGEDINWKSRVIAVADVFDAITSERPYHKALNLVEAAEELKKNAGTQFDPNIVKVFVEKVLELGL